MLKGVDISHHNWATSDLKVKHDPKIANIIRENDFIIMKASEGVGWKDKRLDDNFNLFLDINLKEFSGKKVYGFYHFARADKNTNPIVEADYFLSLVTHHNGKCLYALDYEMESLNNPKSVWWVETWLNHVYEKTGIKPLLYIQSSQCKRFERIGLLGYPLWVAHWGVDVPRFSGWQSYAIWQFQGSPLDLNLFNGDMKMLKALYLTSVEEEKEETQEEKTQKELTVKVGDGINLKINGVRITLYVSKIENNVLYL